MEGEDDRRQRKIVLTAKGKAKMRRAEPLWNAAEAQVAAVLGATELSDLRKRLMAIAHDARLARPTPGDDDLG
jgi:DNA-binding MarR family transcriptional regulator